MNRRSRRRRSLLGWSLAALLAGGAIVTVMPQRARAAADAKGVEFFESKIRPILANNCVGCHGTEKQKGGLRLDTREHLLAGGKDEDKVIVVFDPAHPEKSMIIEAIEYKNEDLQMPPPKKGKSMKLPDSDIATIKEWIKMGAPYGEKPVEAVKGADKGDK
jgi:mono/diheme cytochrome c family protein